MWSSAGSSTSNCRTAQPSTWKSSPISAGRASGSRRRPSSTIRRSGRPGDGDGPGSRLLRSGNARFFGDRFMNVFFAGLATETNSFSAIPTAEEAFAVGQRRGEAVFSDRGLYGDMARRLRELAEAEGGHVSPGLFASAQPGAPTVQAVYERLRDALLDDLRAAAPVLSLIHISEPTRQA